MYLFHFRFCKWRLGRLCQYCLRFRLRSYRPKSIEQMNRRSKLKLRQLLWQRQIVGTKRIAFAGVAEKRAETHISKNLKRDFLFLFCFYKPFGVPAKPTNLNTEALCFQDNRFAHMQDRL